VRLFMVPRACTNAFIERSLSTCIAAAARAGTVSLGCIPPEKSGTILTRTPPTMPATKDAAATVATTKHGRRATTAELMRAMAIDLLRVSPTPPRHLATSPPRQPDPNVRTSRGWMCAHFRGVGFISLSPHQKCAHFLPRGATYATRARAAAARCCVRTSFTSACFLSVGAE
jgi:hypothetical protein